MTNFSLFYGGITKTIPDRSITIKEVINLFTKDEQIKSIIDNIRKYKVAGQNKEADEEKFKLPYITTAGVFKHRSNDGLEQDSYSWVFGIDIDYKDNPDTDWNELFKRISKNPSVILCARSPRGQGLKVLMRAKKNAYKPEDQYIVLKDTVYPHFEAIWKCKLDFRQAVFSQPFFVTFDENAYVNLKAEELVIGYDNVTAESIINGDVSVEIKDLKPFCEGIKNKKDNKWQYFGQMALFCGGLFAGKVLKASKDKILSALISAAGSNIFVENIETAKKQIIKSFENGMKHPIDKDDLKAKANIKSIITKITHDTLPENPYIRIGDDYFEKIIKVNMHGGKEPYLIARKRMTIVDDYGEDFLKFIPKYKTFCNVPDYKNHKFVINKNYNLFQPFQHQAKEGKFDTIHKLYNHIFNGQIEEGFDYTQILYLKPLEILPVLCLVSKVQGTGKTTFIDFLAMLFKGNTAIISTSDIEGNFNQHYAAKHIIAIDESELHKEKTTSKIKQIATQKSEFRKGKFQQEEQIDFFGKLIINSNNESGFINITDQDIRYWVKKVPMLTDFENDFYQKLEEEIPAFVHFLETRKMKHPVKVSRSWFPLEVTQTDEFTSAVYDNKSSLYHDLLGALIDFFDKNNVSEVYLTPKMIREILLNNNNQYTNKYIGKVLKNEFNMTSKMVRFTCPISFLQKIGDAYCFKRSDFLPEMFDNDDVNKINDDDEPF